MTAKAKLLKRYPHLDNRELPPFLCCPSDHSIDEAMRGFQRVCFKDAIIIRVLAMKSDCPPVCFWSVSYQMKNKDYDYDNDSNIPPSQLPEDEASLKQLFEDLTAKCDHIDMEVLRKGHTVLTAIVD